MVFIHSNAYPLEKMNFCGKKKFEYLVCEAFSVLWRLQENSNGINRFKNVCLLI